MKTEERILAKLQELMDDGKRILLECGWDGRRYQERPRALDYARITTEAMNIIRISCGAESDHYRSLSRLAERRFSTDLDECMGIVEAAYRDVKDDYLRNLRTLIFVEVFDDFLDQTEHLLDRGYFVPAASLCGAVLEDSLRKLAFTHNITVPENTTIDRLNADLARAEVYNKLVQKRITALADIRNNADHGHFGRFTKDDVTDMVSWVKRFCADYLV